MTFRKGSTRHKILEGLRELKMDAVLKFMKLYGESDPNNPTATQTVHEVIAGIPRNRLDEALVVVERSAKKVDRAAIQNAAKLYIERTNKENITAEEYRDAVKESTAKILPPGKQGIANTVEAMGKMSREIILSGIDTVINGKGQNTYTNGRWNVTPEEIEKFLSAMREGKISSFENLAEYNVTTPTSDLVFRNAPEYLEDVEIDPAIKIPVPEKDFPEFIRIREAMLAEVYTLAGLTRDAGWLEEDTPGIPKEKFSRAIEFLYMIPEGHETQYWLPHGITASPDGVISFWWKHHRKTVTFALTNFGNDTWLLEYQGNFPQDNNDRFLTLRPGAIEYLVIELKKMYS